MHHGVEGQKWGVRRYQNPDGTLTEEGRIHYGLPKRVPNRKGAFASVGIALEQPQWEVGLNKVHKADKKALKSQYKSGSMSKEEYKANKKSLNKEYNQAAKEINKYLDKKFGKTARYRAAGEEVALGVLVGIGTIAIMESAGNRNNNSSTNTSRNSSTFKDDDWWVNEADYDFDYETKEDREAPHSKQYNDWKESFNQDSAEWNAKYKKAFKGGVNVGDQLWEDPDNKYGKKSSHFNEYHDAEDVDEKGRKRRYKDVYNENIKYDKFPNQNDTIIDVDEDDYKKKR